VLCRRVGVGKHRDRADSEVARGSKDPAGNFAAVRNQ